MELAHDEEVLERFKDGVLWAGLGYQPDLFALLGAWGSALGMSSEELAQLTDLRARAQAIHRKIGLRRMLLVVDDAWQSHAALAFKVGGPNCAYLLTTRQPDIAWDFASDCNQRVHELSEEDSMTLLANFAPKVVISQPDEARALVQAAGGLPLALPIERAGGWISAGMISTVHTPLPILAQTAPKAWPASKMAFGVDEMPNWVRRIGAGMTKITVATNPGTMPSPKKMIAGIR